MSWSEEGKTVLQRGSELGRGGGKVRGGNNKAWGKTNKVGFVKEAGEGKFMGREDGAGLAIGGIHEVISPARSNP